MSVVASTLVLASLTSVSLPPRIRSRNLEEICHSDTSKYRRVSQSMKDRIYAKNGLDRKAVMGEYVVDHIVPLQLGGSNDESNLMLQPVKGHCNSKDKDKLELKLHEMACDHSISLSDAQDEIYADWVSAYQIYVSKTGCAN